ncbi:VOC family protein [Paenibacillus sp. 1P03SA]|uniref:VOC family protein n=1 Tax=Paenibacillus sp. 1P03SA TaxID=3132294 RepID=UPI0039A0AE4D
MDSPIHNKIRTVFIPVSDIGQAAAWYSGILGLPPDGEVLFGHLYVLPMQGAGIVLDSKIYSPEAIFKTPVVQFATGDIERSYAYLKSRGVRLVTGIENGHWFTFADPDGNLLMVCR